MKISLRVLLHTAILLIPLLLNVESRSVDVKLSANWPSSQYAALQETSEFLADEQASYFWQFLDLLENKTDIIQDTLKNESLSSNILSTFAIEVAQDIIPASTNLHELILSTRTYSVKIESHRQLGLDSGDKICGDNVETWAVIYEEMQCPYAVACSTSELVHYLDKFDEVNDTSTQTCIATGVNDIRLDSDHVMHLPLTECDESDSQLVTVILYGTIGTMEFNNYYKALKNYQTETMKVELIVRHFTRESKLPTLLQGYGVALDIKNMEYKTIDEDALKSKNPDGGEQNEGIDNENDDDDDDIDIDGILFDVLQSKYPDLSMGLKAFQKEMQQEEAQKGVNKSDDSTNVKAWHMPDIDILAAREIMDASNPLKKLRQLSQDFPLHSKSLAFSKKKSKIAPEFRTNLESARNKVTKANALNTFLVNGISINVMERSFNIFDLMKTLRKEMQLSERFLNCVGKILTRTEKNTMLLKYQERTQEEPESVQRINLRSTNRVLYLNDLAVDKGTEAWPKDISILRRPAWNLVFLRRNMYEYILIFDAFENSGRGLQAIQQMNTFRMRQAPLQFGWLVSNHEMLETPKDKRGELLVKYKSFHLQSSDEPATSWHLMKLVFFGQRREGEVITKSLDDEQPTVAMFLDKITDLEFVEVNSNSILPLRSVIKCFVQTKLGTEKNVVELLKSDEYDDMIWSMTDLIQQKHLPLDSRLFNGVISLGLNLDKDIMQHLGRDQSIYQELFRNGELTQNSDFPNELMQSQGELPSYFPHMFPDSGESSQKNHMFHIGFSSAIESKFKASVTFFHSVKSSLTHPKIQTLLYVVDLNKPNEAKSLLNGMIATADDSTKQLRVGVIHNSLPAKKVPRNDGSKLITTCEVAMLVIAVAGDSDNYAVNRLAQEALQCCIQKIRAKPALLKLNEYIKTFETSELPDNWDQIKRVLTENDEAVNMAKNLQIKQGPLLKEMKSKGLISSRTTKNYGYLFLNGKKIDIPQYAPISSADLDSLLSFDFNTCTEIISQAISKSLWLKENAESMTNEQANEVSIKIMQIAGLVVAYDQVSRTLPVKFPSEINKSLFSVKMEPSVRYLSASLQIVAYIDPLSLAAQRMSSILEMLHTQLHSTIELFLLPQSNLGEFPIQQFYRFRFDTGRSVIKFNNLPKAPILTLKMETPEAWNVQAYSTTDDLDNLHDDRRTRAEFLVQSLLVYGQCYDTSRKNRFSPPHGLPLVLERETSQNKYVRDTLVMKNLGYFQFQATPGVWHLHIAKGRATDVFHIVNVDSPSLKADRVEVSDFGSHITTLEVKKNPGKENEELLSAPLNESGTIDSYMNQVAAMSSYVGTYWHSMMSMFGEKKSMEENIDSTKHSSQTSISTTVNRGRVGDTIHVFSLASGRLYERFLKIMMLSVMKRTKNPVTFWLLENFFSPSFKSTAIPALRQEFGIDIRLVTYKWPNWLRQQTEKQRIIWGYKILFLDVLFPLGVDKIIYVDADQVVRADLKELWDMDLKGAVYGYTPFCDSRNLGFQFWRQGYWKSHLGERPYHISALYVVDLRAFRQRAAGDLLRALYEQLSADPNSLANLDQDLPNYAQNQLPIHSLPQEWLWCESWCSEESKAIAKTIDLCNNPKHKEPKLEMAKRIINGELFQESWIELDQEIANAETKAGIVHDST